MEEYKTSKHAAKSSHLRGRTEQGDLRHRENTFTQDELLELAANFSKLVKLAVRRSTSVEDKFTIAAVERLLHDAVDLIQEEDEAAPPRVGARANMHVAHTPGDSGSDQGEWVRIDLFQGVQTVSRTLFQSRLILVPTLFQGGPALDLRLE